MGRGTRYPFIENILKVNVKEGASVLEIGAGGAVYRNLFSNYYGTDLAGNPYAEKGDIIAHCDAQAIPFKPETFDAAFVVAALYQIPDPASVLADIHRVLKPGGIFLIFDYNKKRTEKLKLAEREGKNQNHVWSPDDLKNLVQANSFTAEILNHHLFFPSTGSGMKDRIKRSSFYQKTKAGSEGWNVILARKVNDQ